MLYICQYYNEVGAVEADSKEEALREFNRLSVQWGGMLYPKDENDIETLDEFVERAKLHWR